MCVYSLVFIKFVVFSALNYMLFVWLIEGLAIWRVDRWTCVLDGGSIDLRFGWWIDRLAIWMVDRSTCDLDGGSIDFSAGSMPALKSVDHFIKVSAKYKMLLHPARPMICQSTFLYLADLTRL